MKIKNLEKQLGRKFEIVSARKPLPYQREIVYFEDDRVIQLSIKLDKIVPTEILNFKYLETLNLRYSSRLDLSFLQLYVNLKELRLYCTSESIIPESIFELKSLQRLHIDHKLVEMDERILELENLKDLRISIGKDQKLRFDLVNQLNLHSLALLDYISNPKNIIAIRNPVKKLSFARSDIDFSCIDLAGTKVSEISISTSTACNYNFAGIEELETIKIRLSKVKINEINYLGASKLSLEQVEIIGNFSYIIQTNKQLIDLSINETNIENLNHICSLSNLKILMIKNNNILKIPQCLMSLSNLRLLDVSFNQISRIDVNTLMASNLTILNIKHNPIEKSNKKELENLSEKLDIIF